MNKNILTGVIIISFIGLSVFYYFIGFLFEIDKIFLTIATFLFAIFAGFFISRQGSRYSDIRGKIANFDGGMSSTYRSSGHLGEDIQNKMGEIIKSHYQAILENKMWDYHFMHKSVTITSIHQVLENVIADKMLNSLKNAALIRIMNTLYDLQINRKNMVALYQERIPAFQWALIYFLAFILFVAISSISSYHQIVDSILKSAFTNTIFVVVILLKQLDRLHFFEGTIGEKSAEDVLGIIQGVK